MINNPLANSSNAEIAKAFREANAIIDEALRLIRDHEDGPFTMTVTIREIRDRVNALESEIWLLQGDLSKQTEISIKLREELGTAVRQRDILLRQHLKREPDYRYD
jgi:hypothetical protein